MSVLRILPDSDPALHKVCHPVTAFDRRLHRLLDDMQETLAHAQGYGLAAPQIGILRRVVLVTGSDDRVIELINPEIVRTEGEQEDWEGCLSLPGYCGLVKRPMTVRVRAQDRHGKFFEVEDSGMTARCFCHEVDHLDGKLYSRLAEKLYTNEEAAAMMEDGDEA